MCSGRKIEQVRLFIESGYSYDVHREGNERFIYYEEEIGDICFRNFAYLCLRGYLDMIKVLVSTGFDVSSESCCDGFRKTCWEGHNDAAEFLLKNGVDINSTNSQGNSGLHLACLNNCVNVVECLVEYGADLNIRNNKGETALDFVKYKFGGGKHLVFLLLGHGVNYKQGLVKHWKIEAVQQRIEELGSHSEVIYEKFCGRIAKLVIEFSFGIENLKEFLQNNTTD